MKNLFKSLATTLVLLMGLGFSFQAQAGWFGESEAEMQIRVEKEERARAQVKAKIRQEQIASDKKKTADKFNQMISGLGASSMGTVTFENTETGKTVSSKKSYPSRPKRSEGWMTPAEIDRINKAEKAKNSVLAITIHGDALAGETLVEYENWIENINMAKVKKYVFLESLNAERTPKKNAIAKFLTKELKLWDAYARAGGDGIREVVAKAGLGGHSKTNYRPHTGNFFVWSYHFKPSVLAVKARVKASDFVKMGIEPEDVYLNNISSRIFVLEFSKIRRANPVKISSR